MTENIVRIENRSSVITVIDHEIISVFIKPNMEFEISDVDDISDSIEKLREGKEALILVDVSENTTGNSEVREYSASHGAINFAKAIAYVTNSLAQKIVVNFFIILYRKHKPVRMFTSKKEAIDWLKNFN